MFISHSNYIFKSLLVHPHCRHLEGYINIKSRRALIISISTSKLSEKVTICLRNGLKRLSNAKNINEVHVRVRWNNFLWNVMSTQMSYLSKHKQVLMCCTQSSLVQHGVNFGIDNLNHKWKKYIISENKFTPIESIANNRILRWLTKK